MIVLLFFLTSFFSLHARSANEELFDSCIRHYDCSKQGRNTHEYYPFLLKKAAASMDELEKRFEQEGLKLFGRMIISGYEEQAIPSYYTDYAKPEIVDEQCVQSEAGCIIPPHNRFGLMTGFLFKDINFIARNSLDRCGAKFEHINPEFVEIFDGNGTIFQKDAFGQSYYLLRTKQDAIEQLCVQGNSDGVFEELIDMWETMYRAELTSGNEQIVGTQDILFSVEYGRHLRRSPLQLLHYFTGGDITYPIEVSLIHGKEVTFNAQTFVERFAKELQPRDGKKTAYVFCSFVDGVGKSTMLGNVKNWFAHGREVEMYDHVDNSSSQFADVHQLTDDVIIVDLPAQVSHFTYKPDGSVYVDVRTTTQKEEDLVALYDVVRERKKAFVQEYFEAMKTVRSILECGGFFAPELHDPENPLFAFIKNLYLLDEQATNRWIPFQFEQQHYVFDSNDISQVRKLQSLNTVKSHGLKNVEPAQMLFFHGVRFPIDYELFLKDLVSKTKASGAEQVVFVDFMSMYPRSCRENIRVNYILQQMALLYPGFEIKNSFYRDLLDDAHLFCLLRQDEQGKFLQTFRDEIALRWALFSILEKGKRDNLDGVGFATLSQQLRDEIANMPLQDRQALEKLSEMKLESELQHLEEQFGMRKEFINIYQFSCNQALAFSSYLESLFVKHVDCERLNQVWKMNGTRIISEQDAIDGTTNKTVRLDASGEMNACFAMPSECRDAALFEPFVQQLRANWYAALSNLIFNSGVKDKKFVIDYEEYLVTPMHLKMNRSGKVFIVQPQLPEWTDGDAMEFDFTDAQLSKFHVRGETIEWAEFDKEPYLITWANNGTNYGLYAFDCQLGKSGSYSSSHVTRLVRKYQKEHDSSTVMPTRDLYFQLSEDGKWNAQQEKMIEAAIENAEKNDDEDENKKEEQQELFDPFGMPSLFDEDELTSKKYKNMQLIQPGQIQGIRQALRSIATLEMIMKDPNADVVVRRGNKHDFIAAIKLLEEVVLPKYFDLISPEPLFDDYTKIEPVLGWDAVR